MCPWIQRQIIDHKYQKQLNHDHLLRFITGTTVDPPAESGGWVLNVNWTHSYYYLVRDTQMIFGEGGPGKIRLQFSLALRKQLNFSCQAPASPRRTASIQDSMEMNGNARDCGKSTTAWCRAPLTVGHSQSSAIRLGMKQDGTRPSRQTTSGVIGQLLCTV